MKTTYVSFLAYNQKCPSGFYSAIVTATEAEEMRRAYSILFDTISITPYRG